LDLLDAIDEDLEDGATLKPMTPTAGMPDDEPYLGPGDQSRGR
jgi:hypothetical protein